MPPCRLCGRRGSKSVGGEENQETIRRDDAKSFKAFYLVLVHTIRYLAF